MVQHSPQTCLHQAFSLRALRFSLSMLARYGRLPHRTAGMREGPTS
jgi:hypothetical protein